MAAPSIVPRSQWGGRGSRSGTIAPNRRSYYVVHYPVMGNRDERQWMRDIESMHINQKWGMIGYSYCIGQSGTIYEGCGLTTRPIHSPTRNSDAWGVCHLLPTTAQGVATAQISDAMKRASVALYNWLGQQAGRQLTKWWHGRDYATACPGPDLRAWVQAGMPAPGGAPAPTPTPQAEDDDMITSVVAGGQTLVFAVSQDRNFVGVTWQSGNLAWAGAGRSGAGWPAGMSRFANAPGGHKIVGISAVIAASGVPHVFVRTDRGETYVTWQTKDGWTGRGNGRHAGFSHFAARP